MVNKTKIKKSVVEKVTDNAMQAGIVLMTAAVTLGLVEVPHDPDKRAIVPLRPVFEMANHVNEDTSGGSTIRRERDETGPHYISYGINQRTPSRTGKI